MKEEQENNVPEKTNSAESIKVEKKPSDSTVSVKQKRRESYTRSSILSKVGKMDESELQHFCRKSSAKEATPTEGDSIDISKDDDHLTDKDDSTERKITLKTFDDVEKSTVNSIGSNKEDMIDSITNNIVSPVNEIAQDGNLDKSCDMKKHKDAAETKSRNVDEAAKNTVTVPEEINKTSFEKVDVTNKATDRSDEKDDQLDDGKPSKISNDTSAETCQNNIQETISSNAEHQQVKSHEHNEDDLLNHKNNIDSETVRDMHESNSNIDIQSDQSINHSNNQDTKHSSKSQLTNQDSEFQVFDIDGEGNITSETAPWTSKFDNNEGNDQTQSNNENENTCTVVDRVPKSDENPATIYIDTSMTPLPDESIQLLTDGTISKDKPDNSANIVSDKDQELGPNAEGNPSVSNSSSESFDPNASAFAEEVEAEVNKKVAKIINDACDSAIEAMENSTESDNRNNDEDNMDDECDNVHKCKKGDIGKNQGLKQTEEKYIAWDDDGVDQDALPESEENCAEEAIEGNQNVNKQTEGKCIAWDDDSVDQSAFSSKVNLIQSSFDQQLDVEHMDDDIEKLKDIDVSNIAHDATSLQIVDVNVDTEEQHESIKVEDVQASLRNELRTSVKGSYGNGGNVLPMDRRSQSLRSILPSDNNIKPQQN